MLCLLSLGPVARAQAPAWQTAVGQGPINSSGVPGANSYIVVASAADAAGNIFLTGVFAGTASFGSISLTTANGGDAFVAKYSPATGNFLWAQQAGSSVNSNVNVSAIAVSGTSLYLAGGFNGPTALFGSPMLANSGGNVFVVKLTDTGSGGAFGWVQRSTISANGYGNLIDMAVTGANVYLLGGFSGAITFGGSRTLTAVPGSTSYSGTISFLAKFTDAGTSASFGYAGTINGAPAKVAAKGTNVYVAGVFDGPTITFGTTTLTNANAQDRDIFITGLLDAGTSASYLGAQRGGGSSRDRVFGLGATATGAVVVGDFFGPATFGSTTLAGGGNFNNYEAKWNPTSGAFDWAQQSDYFVRSVAVNGTGIYLAGSFRTGTFGGTTLTSVGGGTTIDAFVARFTDAGPGPGPAFNWVQRAGGTEDDDAAVVSLGGTRVVVQGLFYSPTAAFGTINLARTGSSGVRNDFLATLIDPTLTAAAAPAALAGLALFPNPAHTATTVRLPAVPGTVAATLTLLDALGRAVRTLQVPLPAAGATAEVPLAGLAPGLYRLRVQAGGQQGSRALAVE